MGAEAAVAAGVTYAEACGMTIDEYARAVIRRRRANTADAPNPSTDGDGGPANSAHSEGASRPVAERATYGEHRHGAASAPMLMTEETRLSELIGHNILLARTELGQSMRVLGDAVGQNRREISRWEKGERQPSEANLRLIAEALGKPFLWFFDEHPDA